jgi:hypothetical protein
MKMCAFGNVGSYLKKKMNFCVSIECFFNVSFYSLSKHVIFLKSSCSLLHKTPLFRFLLATQELSELCYRKSFVLCVILSLNCSSDLFFYCHCTFLISKAGSM